MQSTLDFSGKLPPAVQEKIADGMKRADESADHVWKRVLDGCVLAVARRLNLLTVEDVLKELIAVNEIRKAQGKEPVETHNLSALGPAMIRASKDSIISQTNEVRRNKMPGKNGNLMRVWRSNFYEGTQ